MSNQVLYFEYNINSPYDDEVLFPGICAVRLFDQLHLRNHIAIKFVVGIPGPDRDAQIVHIFSRRQDVAFFQNQQHGGMIFKFLDTLESNNTLLPLLQLDSIGTQYIVSPEQSSVDLAKLKWHISEKDLIRLDLAKFICSLDQDRSLQLFFNAKYYNIKDLRAQLTQWEQSICKITGMSRMERNVTNPFGIPRFVNITVY